MGASAGRSTVPDTNLSLSRIDADAAERGQSALATKIRWAMADRQLYRRSNLTVARLARVIGSQEYLVRRTINAELGHRNFNQFLHGYRLGEALPRLLVHPRKSILSIALDAGYGSIGPFNRAFRARFGVTPRELRAESRSAVTRGMHTLYLPGADRPFALIAAATSGAD